MLKFIKLKKHKGISELYINNLGNLNVVCGKNNSGKTSILEAITKKENRALGKKVDDVEWLMKIFEPLARTYNQPNPNDSENWFRNHVQKLIENETVWYSDEFPHIKDQINADKANNPALKGYATEIFRFESLLVSFFQNILENFEPVLVPPKRNLETLVQIDFKQNISPEGTGLINRLFFLKTQSDESLHDKTYTNILKAFHEITGYNFDITPDHENRITLYFKKNDENWIISDACGLGLSDVLVMISFAIGFDYSLILIEEPESHLHPEMQKKLLNFFKKIKSRQFIFSTHSSIFLNPYVVERIFYSKFENTVKLSDETSKSEILYNLGYSVSDNLVSDVVVLTEGPTDIPVLSTICQWIGILDKYNIKFWPLGGDIMADLDLSIFAERNNIIALIDSDPGSKVIRTRFEKNCKEYEIKCKRLKYYSIENYFTLEAIKKVLPSLSLKIKKLDPNISVDEQLGFVGPKGKTKTIKSKNHLIIKNMSWSDIEKTDLGNFCLEIKKMCVQS